MPIKEKTVIICVCVRCGHEWQMRHKRVEDVQQCPHCRTIYWNEAKTPKWKMKGGRK